MGHVWIDLEVSNVAQTKRKTMRALADTGATLTTLPRSFAQELGIDTVAKEKVETAAGLIEIEKGRALLKIGEKEDIQTVWISDVIDKVLVGCVTMDTLGLKVNPLSGQLEQAALLLYSML